MFGLKGKTLSHFLKMLSVFVVIVGYIIAVVKSGKLPNSDEVFGLVQLGLFIMTVSSPIDISMIINNLKGNKKDEN